MLASTKFCLLFFCRIINTDVLLVAMYIPPSNSAYFDERYFENLDLIFKTFRSYQLIILGDLNSRIGTPSYDATFCYVQNPDTSTNANGIRLLKWLMNNDIVIVNGLIRNHKCFDSNFTFFRGSLCSQNDLILSNSPSIIDSMKIMNKMIYSDHTPISTNIVIKPSCSRNFLLRCSEGTLCDDHLDINKRKPPVVILSKVD